MFERFTEPARRVVFFARYEASQYGSRSIEPYHLLLGLLRDGTGLAHTLLDEAGTPADLRNEIRGHVLVGPRFATSVEIPFSTAAKQALTFAAEEADGLTHGHMGPEHLLLGILRAGDSTAAAILHGRGLHLARVRERVAGRT